MKKLFFLFAAILMTANVMAQDIIVTRDARKIDAKVLEISKTEIKYKTTDNLDGPTYILSTEDLVTIIYANGKVELFNIDGAKKAEGIARANAMGSLFGNSGNTGDGQKGNPVGHGEYTGNSWSLNGREIIGSLPRPSNDFKQEGRVVVEIRVNAAGNVIFAKAKGGSISDKHTIQLAVDAAKRAKFTSGEGDILGTITYCFKFD